MSVHVQVNTKIHQGQSFMSPTPAAVLQRKCACGTHTPAGGECTQCGKKKQFLQRAALSYIEGGNRDIEEFPPIVHDVLRSSGQPLDLATRGFFEPRFGHDFSKVRVHTDAQAAESARAVNALVYTVGRDVVFGTSQYAPETHDGKRLLAHELTHVVQQGLGVGTHRVLPNQTETSTSYSLSEQQADATADAVLDGHAPVAITPAFSPIQLRAAPYIKKVGVHLAPPQSADLEWEGTPPTTATGSDHFTVSTGKGYSDPGDPPGTCTRNCCSDPMTQCAPPWNRPSRVGACCTFYGNNFWTGTPRDEHNGWQWWTPIQPHYSSRGIALHQHTDVTGQPIGHGCVRMDEPNAKRIYDYSNGRRTNVTIDGRAAPVACDPDRQCGGSGGGGNGARLDAEASGEQLVMVEPAVPGLEGEMT